MANWFKDGVFRSILRNAGYLITGKVASALLGVVALSCVGRGLGPALFGVLTLIHSYALGVSALVKFQSWQLVIRYGAPAHTRGEPQTVRDSINLAFGLDLASGLAGLAIALLVLPWLAPHFGIERRWLPLATIYCTLIPTMASATPTGVLRLLDRFDITAWQQIVTPALRAAGAGLAFWLGLGFPFYVAAWYFADLSGDLVNWAMALRELHRREMLRGLTPGLLRTARRLPDAWSFVWTTNIATSLGASWSSLSNLVIGGLLGPVAAGLYRIATTLLDSAGKPADLLTRGFYPEIMRLDPASRKPWRVALRVGALTGGMGLVMVLVLWAGGRPLIGAVFGHRYLPAYRLVTLMMVALAVNMAGFPLQSLLYMAGRQRVALAVQAAATVSYLALLAVLAMRFGLVGAGIAYVLGNVAQVVGMLVPVLGSYRNRAALRRVVSS